MIRAASVTAAMLAAAVALAACGVSSPTKPSKQAAVNGGGNGLKLAECMRSHGVPNFPDPQVSTGPDGRGVGIRIGAKNAGGAGGLNPQSPAFQAAQKVCMPLLGGPKGLPTKKAGG